MDQISPFITSITKKVASNPTILIGIAVSVVCIIFVYNPFSYEEKDDVLVAKKDCPKIKDCNSYSSSLCLLIITFIYLVSIRKIIINSPIMDIFNKGNTPNYMVPIN